MRCFHGTLRTLHKWMRERGTRPRTSGEIGEPKMSKNIQATRAFMGFIARQFVKPDKRSPKDRGANKETRDALKEHRANLGSV